MNPVYEIIVRKLHRLILTYYDKAVWIWKKYVNYDENAIIRHPKNGWNNYEPFFSMSLTLNLYQQKSCQKV